MKIIHVTPNYPPSIGGVQNVAYEISNGLAKDGYDVTVYTSNLGNEKEINYKIGAPKVHYLKNFSLAHTFIAPSLFFKLLTIPEDSVIHVHIARAFFPEVVYLISKIRRIPYIAHYHLDIGASGKMGFLLPLYKKFVLKNILKGAKKIIVLSRPNQKIVENLYGIKDNILVIPNGVSDDYFVKRKLKKTKVTNLLYIGRISVQKQVNILIDALKFVKNKVVFDIVGGGELEQDIKKLIRKNKLKNIRLHGPKKGKELIRFYKKGEIFLLSSNREGMPLVLLEAMAAGLPVIASNVEGTREFVGKDGILVKPNTPEKFAEAIDNVIRSRKLYRELATKSVEKARRFRWRNIIEKIEKLYSEIQR